MASSMQEYLKRYASEAEKPQKKKKRKNKAALKGSGGLTMVDGDPIWQKDVKEASSESEAEQGDAPLVIEDVEFKRMQRLEALRMRPYIATAEDGSGWVSVNESLNQGSSEQSIKVAMSPSRKAYAQVVSSGRSGADHNDIESTFQTREREMRKSRSDTPEGDVRDNSAQHYDQDLSPQRKERNSERRRHDTPVRDLSPPRHPAPASEGSPESSSPRTNLDLSPPRRRQTSSVADHHDSSELSPSRTGKLTDLSPPRRRQPSLRSGRHDSPDLSPPRTGKSGNMSPPRPRKTILKLGSHNSSDSSPPRRGGHADLSPARRKQISLRSGPHDRPESSSPRTAKNLDLSPPRRGQTSSRKGHNDSSEPSPSGAGHNLDLSPPRRRLTSTRIGHRDSFESSPPRIGKSLGLSPPRKSQTSSRMVDHDEDDTDFSLQRKFNCDESDSRGLQKLKRKETMADGTAAGLQSGKQLAKQTERKKKDESARLKEVDVSVSGRHANTVYRDKHGKRLEGVDEILKLQQAEEPNKEEKPLEWGRGLVQKREAEARYAELEAEKKKPFARSRDDPDLEKALKERIRWGDPMAHLVKNAGEPVLLDLGANELMKESGFIVPQSVPKHSWLKRGVSAPPNRYSIKPGRHWDGVDRSTGYEREMFKRQNEKEADRVEAYLWSVADM